MITCGVPSITVLPPPLVSRLHSTGVLGGLAHAVEECVCNSVDGEATDIEVEIDAQSFSFVVRDNGVGIAPEDLQHAGAAHATSKLRSVEQFEAGLGTLGFRGEALAAICGTAVVEITSRARGSFETHRKLLSAGAVLKCGLAPEQRAAPGTTVQVRDLLWNQPVRRKAIVTAGLQREVDRCKAAVYRLALLRPGVAFALHDRGKRSCVLRLPRGRSLQQSAAEFLGHPAAERIVPIASPAAGAAVALSGEVVIPPHGYPTTARQCCFVNGRPVAAPLVSKMVDGLFQQLYIPNARLLVNSGGGGGGERELQAVQAAANLHAMFILHIQCSPALYAVAHEPGKPACVEFQQWEPVLRTVKRAVLAAWRPVLSLALLGQLGQLEQSCGTEDGEQQGPAAASGSRPPGKRSWSGKRGGAGSGKQILSSRSVRYGAVLQPQSEAAPAAETERRPAVPYKWEAEQQRKKPRPEAGAGWDAAPAPSWQPEVPQRSIPWRQTPVLTSSERTLLDLVAYQGRPPSPRRCQSAPPHPRRQTRAMRSNQAPSMRTVAAPGASGSASILAWRRLRAPLGQPGQQQRGQAKAEPSKPRSGLQRLEVDLKPASRPAPQRQQQQQQQQQQPRQQQPWPQQQQQVVQRQQVQQAAGPRPVVGVLLSSWRQDLQPAAVEGILDLQTISAAAFAPLAPAALTHEQLCSGRALQQVDLKFVPLVTGSVLALVDQHAADERVQLEQLRERLLAAHGSQQEAPGPGSDLRSMALGAPLPLAIEGVEAEILETYGDRLVKWGWAWAQDTGSGLVLTHVPLVFGTALTSTDMKLYLHQLEETCGAAGLPAAVLRVLNSKACRSAIMFGDALLPAQCQGLLEALAGTELWSCCAHGRPTTWPAVDLVALRRGVAVRSQARLQLEHEEAKDPTPLPLLRAKLLAAMGSV